MKKLTQVGMLCTFLLSCCLFSCNSFMDEIIEDESVGPNTDLEIIAKLGFDISTVEEFDDHYVVEGDIIIRKDGINNYLDAAVTRHYHYGSLVSQSKAANIKVFISTSITSNNSQQWVEATQEALRLWNDCGSGIEMMRTLAEAEADIIVRRETEYPGGIPSNVFGIGSWPQNGNPGNEVYVNYNFIASLNNHSSRVFNVVHELGHCLGLRHTNMYILDESASNSVHIPGTPSGTAKDTNSVFNGGVAGTPWTSFSYYDLVAIKYLYPAVTITAPKDVDNGQFIELEATGRTLKFYDWYAKGAGIHSGNGTSKVSVKIDSEDDYAYVYLRNPDGSGTNLATVSMYVYRYQVLPLGNPLNVVSGQQVQFTWTGRTESTAGLGSWSITGESGDLSIYRIMAGNATTMTASFTPGRSGKSYFQVNYTHEGRKYSRLVYCTLDGSGGGGGVEPFPEDPNPHL